MKLVRFGKFGEVSKNHLTGRMEKGVSVFDLQNMTLQQKFTWNAMLQNQEDYSVAYEVEGEVVGKGFDGEPLLKNIKILNERKITEYEKFDVTLTEELRYTIIKYYKLGCGSEHINKVLDGYIEDTWDMFKECQKVQARLIKEMGIEKFIIEETLNGNF